MSSKDIAEAAAKAQARKKLLKTPVPMRPDAPENITLSKAEFIAKRRAEKEEEAKVSDFRANLKAKKEIPSGEKEEGQKEVVVEKKKYYKPKKVVE